MLVPVELMPPLSERWHTQQSSPPLISFKATCSEQRDQGSQGGTVRTHRRESIISDRGNILMFDKGVGLDQRNEPQRRAQSQLIEAETMSAIGRMACSISHDMRHSLTAIYANAEFFERHDLWASVRAAQQSSSRTRYVSNRRVAREAVRFCCGGLL
jgi:C4-dicarboxylate-specific signal transduction histidine kinase